MVLWCEPLFLIYGFAFQHMQILTYTSVYTLPRRRMLCVQIFYLGDLETDWLSPLWGSQGYTTEPVEKHHCCVPPASASLCWSSSLSTYCRPHLLSNQHGQATCPHTHTQTARSQVHTCTDMLRDSPTHVDTLTDMAPNTHAARICPHTDNHRQIHIN